jgi:hypothetical protein
MRSFAASCAPCSIGVSRSTSFSGPSIPARWQ